MSSQSQEASIEQYYEKFRYVLQYMREENVAGLPHTISEETFLQDLAYCGFQDVYPATIPIMGSDETDGSEEIGGP